MLDTHLGRLATYLRLLGFDTIWEHNCPDERLATISARERRILLTRDRGLLKRSAVTHGYFVRNTDPRAQLTEVVRRFDLYRLIRPFSRCLCCNTPLKDVAKSEVWDRLPPKVRACCDEFRLCPGCKRVYWKGTHYERMAQLIAQVLNSNKEF